MPLSAAPSRVAFGLFEADLVSGELWKAGFRVKLQGQPFRVLAALLERPGELVSREELQERLWGRQTTVDYDHSLGTAVNKIREALGDSAENPRFVETLARRGYRFIAPVRPIAPETAVANGSSVTPEFITPAAGGAGLRAPEMPGSDAARRAERRDSGRMETGVAPQVLAPLAARTAIADAAVGDTAIVSAAAGGPSSTAASGAGGRRWSRTRVRWAAPALAAMILLAAAVTAFLFGRGRRGPEIFAVRQVTHGGQIMATYDAMESFPATVTDGVHLFTATLMEGRPTLVQASVAGGPVVPLSLPDEVAGPVLAGISPDGSRLLVRSHPSNESEQPLWLVPVTGGSAQRLPGVLAHDATWMPDGNAVLYAAGNELGTVSVANGAAQPFARLPGRAFWLRWSPDGTRLRFTLFDPIAHTQSLWELGLRDRTPHPLLRGWNEPADECCGVWTADARSFVFRSLQNGQSDLWRLPGSGGGRPERLTNGPFNYENPVAARSGSRIFFTGADMQSEMQVYHPEAHEFRPAHTFFSDAHRLEFSRDRQWVAWVDTDERLWRARADGTEKLQLTPESMQVFLAHWSPDGTRLALMARERGRAWHIYQVLADGSALENLLHESRNAGDPTWSPDGQSLAFGRVPDFMGKESASRTIQVLDLRSRAVRTLPGSEGMFSPRWSPDGRYIVAMSLDQRRLMLFDTATERWIPLVERSVADPVWSPDGRWIYVQAPVDARKPIYRVAVPGGRVEEVASVTGFRDQSVADYFFCGLLADGTPAVRVQSATGNIYSLDLAAE